MASVYVDTGPCTPEQSAASDKQIAGILNNASDASALAFSICMADFANPYCGSAETVADTLGAGAHGLDDLAAETAFATASNKAVFWSGIRGGDSAAASWAAKNGGMTLESTMASRGITLPAWDASNPSVVNAWQQASAAFARGAQGNVTVLQETAVRTNSVWAQVEYPALTANPHVTSITAVNPVTGSSNVLWTRP